MLKPKDPDYIGDYLRRLTVVACDVVNELEVPGPPTHPALRALASLRNALLDGYATEEPEDRYEPYQDMIGGWWVRDNESFPERLWPVGNSIIRERVARKFADLLNEAHRGNQ